jgi:hypothetical protein
MVGEPDATRQPTPHDIQLMSKHRVLSLKPQLRLEWRGQDGQNETEQPDHSASLSDSITASTRIRFSVHTGVAKPGKDIRRQCRKPYYLRPDGKVGHDAFAVIRETIREMNKVAIGRVVLTNREHIIALEPLDKGLIGTLLRYPYEVRDPQEYFDEIQDVKVTKDMLDLARHIVDQKAGHFEPDKFEDQYETALVDLINQKRAGKPITKSVLEAKTWST